MGYVNKISHLISTFVFGILVRTHEDGPEEAAIDRGGIQDDGVFLVVT
jgi:hypothetical protein